jgi:uroporphyrinogen-III synthase
MSGRVLITREPNRAARLLKLLHDEGIDAVAVPVTEIVSYREDKLLPDLSKFRWLAFTSVNAVVAFDEVLRAEQILLPTDLRIAVVGPATGSECAHRLRKPDLLVKQNNAVSLTYALIATDKEIAGNSILWPCARTALPDFASRLTNAGVTVIPLPCYSTEPISAELLRTHLVTVSPWVVAVFAAPSAVSSFTNAWPKPWDFECVAIGTTTAKTLLTAGVQSPIISLGTDPQDLCDAIKVALDRRRNNLPLLL